MKDIAKQIIQKEAERRWQLLSTEGAHHDQGTMAYRIKAHNSMAEQGRKQFIDSHQWLIDALPESEWVSAESGVLPEKKDRGCSEMHLVICKPLQKEATAIGYYNHLDERWYVVGYGAPIVTHYQPLPSPPKQTT